MDIAKIRPIDALYKEDANDLLKEAMDQNFETVIIFGFKEGKIHITSSRIREYLNVLGALEEAKARLIKGVTL